MPDLEIALPSGAIVALQVDDSYVDSMRPIAAGDKARTLGREAFERGISAAGELASLAQGKLQASGLDYTEAEMHMGIEFSGGVDVKVVRAGAKSSLTFTLRWTAGGAP